MDLIKAREYNDLTMDQEKERKKKVREKEKERKYIQRERFRKKETEALHRFKREIQKERDKGPVTDLLPKGDKLLSCFFCWSSNWNSKSPSYSQSGAQRPYEIAVLT